MRLYRLLPFVVMGLFAGKARADDAVTAGMDAFDQTCIYCHSSDADKVNGVGPFLFGVYGRTAGTAPGYVATPTLVTAGAKGLSWDAKTLDKFLSAPEKMVPGTTMKDVVKKDADRKNIIAYLKSLK